MCQRVGFFFLFCLGLIACNFSEKPSHAEGIYVHTYTAGVIYPESGEPMGSRTVRDTIFIKISGDEYEITNRKWILNDYDKKGWVTAMPGEPEPMSPFFTEYDPETESFLPSLEDSTTRLFLEDDRIYRGEAKALEYIKVIVPPTQ